MLRQTGKLTLIIAMSVIPVGLAREGHSLSAAERALASMGPLRVHPQNPRYFADAAGRAVWLTGSHTWANLQERGVAGETPDFDYKRYLDFLEKHGHNFIRLWGWEHTQWMQFVDKETPIRYEPSPWRRTGPGRALDGKLKFDLTKFNEPYFDRLRDRVEKARARRIYVAVMFFQGFSLDKRRGNKKTGNAWHGHPFNSANNINGISGNPSKDDSGRETHTLSVPAVTRLQEAYVRKTIDTLNNLDNLLWEIGNECHTASVPWQSHMVPLVRRYESRQPNQHVIGMTGAPIKEEDLLASPADWISPPGRQWLDKPPATDGRKIIIVDSDHCAPWDHSSDWVWKNFTRGNHFILMDGYMDYRKGTPQAPDPTWDSTRQTMGHARRLAERLELAELAPASQLASTGYCLADPGRKYLVFQAGRGAFRVDLEQAIYTVEWIDPYSGRTVQTETLATQGGEVKLTPPASGTALVLVSSKNRVGTKNR